MLWRDAAELSATDVLTPGEHFVRLAAGRTQRLVVVGDLSGLRGRCVPVLIGTRYPTRRGPAGPFWSATRLGRRLGPHVRVDDPTAYLDPFEAWDRYLGQGGARAAIAALLVAVARVSGSQLLLIGGGGGASMAIEAAASCGGTALVWNPLSDPDPSAAGARSQGRRFVAEAASQGELDLCELPLPPRLLLVQNADDRLAADVIGPFLDAHEMVAGDPGTYCCDDAHLVAFPRLGAGVTELTEGVLAAAVVALGEAGKSVREGYRTLVDDAIWARAAAPADLRRCAADISAAAELDVDWSGPVRATIGWRGPVPDGLRTDFVAYGPFGRLATFPGGEAGVACWPGTARVTHIVVHLVDECGHELARLRAAAPLPTDGPESGA